MSIKEKLDIVNKLFLLTNDSSHASRYDDRITFTTMNAEVFRNKIGLYAYPNKEQITFKTIIADSGGAVVAHKMEGSKNLQRLNSNYKFEKNESHYIYLTVYPEKLRDIIERWRNMISKYKLTEEFVTLLFDPKKRRLSWPGDLKRFCNFEQRGENNNRQLEILELFINSPKGEYTAERIAQQISHYETGGANNIMKEIGRLNAKVIDNIGLPTEKRFNLILHQEKYLLNSDFQIKTQAKNKK